MKARELRLNNYVWENYGGAYIVRGILDKNTIEISKTEKTISVPFKIDELRPVPMTQDWLLRFGFTKVPKMGEDLVFKKDFFEYWLEDGDIYFKCCMIEEDIKYAHQLQNLYWSIMGEELILKIE